MTCRSRCWRRWNDAEFLSTWTPNNRSIDFDRHRIILSYVFSLCWWFFFCCSFKISRSRKWWRLAMFRVSKIRKSRGGGIHHVTHQWETPAIEVEVENERFVSIFFFCNFLRVGGKQMMKRIAKSIKKRERKQKRWYWISKKKRMGKTMKYSNIKRGLWGEPVRCDLLLYYTSHTAHTGTIGSYEGVNFQTSNKVLPFFKNYTY